MLLGNLTSDGSLYVTTEASAATDVQRGGVTLTKNGAVHVNANAPQKFDQGKGFMNNGDLCIDLLGSAVVGYVGGLPVTATGALKCQLNQPVSPGDVYVGGMRVGPLGGLYITDVSPPTFSPLSLFASGAQGAWYDPSDFSTMFQDSAGTTPVTAVGQPVGKILDKSGRNNHATQPTAGSRPVLQQDGNGKYYLDCNGSSQCMLTGNINFNATVTVSTFFGLYKDIQTQAIGYLLQLSTSLTSNSGSFALSANGYNETGSSHGAALRGSASVGHSSPINAAIPPKTFISSVLYNWAGSTLAQQLAMRVNGVAQTASGTFTSTAVAGCSNRPLYIGYNGTNQWFKGRLYSVIVLGRTATTQEVLDTESWVNGKTAAVASSPPVNTVAPVVSGSTPVGSLLSCTTGTWTGNPTIAYTYQWKADSAGIAGATTNTYTTLAGDEGKTVTCQVTAQNISGVASATSNGIVVTAAPSFSPLSLFAAGEQGVWYDPSDFSSMFQDAAGTVPVTAVGQPVGKILDKSGRNNHATQATAASRPVLQQDGNGKYYLGFDGVDDSMVTAAINFTATDKLSVVGGLYKASDANSIIVLELSTNSGSTNGTFLLRTPYAAGQTSLSWNLRGDASSVYYLNNGYAAPTTKVLTAIMDLAQASLALELIPRINGVVVQSDGSGGTAGGGNFGNYPLYIGARVGNTQPLNGRLYPLIIRGALSSAQEIADTETWVNGKTGAY
jgi:hypothetical protein